MNVLRVILRGVACSCAGLRCYMVIDVSDALVLSSNIVDGFDGVESIVW